MTTKKILIADDSVTVQLMYRMLLSDGPWTLRFANNGHEALELAAAETPDLIFLDVMMPELDGFAACKQLRAGEATRKTPIIMVTTRGEQRNVDLGYQSGCNEYLTKPFNGDELLARVRTNLGLATP